MCVFLRTKFQISSMILTSFRKGREVILNTPPPPQNEALKSPPRLGFNLLQKIPEKYLHLVVYRKYQSKEASLLEKYILNLI